VLFAKSLGIKWLDWIDQPLWCRMLYLNAHEADQHMTAFDDAERSRLRAAQRKKDEASRRRR
jgi:hypothetical protein